MHRVRQFVAHLRARVSTDEMAMVRNLLGPPAAELFAAMPVADRRHALDVVARLRAAGNDDPDLLAAALLHDAAKGDRMRLWHRVAGVLLEALAPRILRRLAGPDPRSWRHPFHLYLHHGPMSAAAARATGCPPRVAAFIVGEVQTDADRALLAALRTADEAS